MDNLVDIVVWLIDPFFYLLFVVLFCVYILKPLFSYLAMAKIIREQRQLHSEYCAHKAKIKAEKRKMAEMEQGGEVGEVVDGG